MAECGCGHFNCYSCAVQGNGYHAPRPVAREKHRGKPERIPFTRKDGGIELRLLVPLLDDPDNPSSWTQWVEPTEDEAHKGMSGD